MTATKKSKRPRAGMNQPSKPARAPAGMNPPPCRPTAHRTDAPPAREPTAATTTATAARGWTHTGMPVRREARHPWAATSPLQMARPRPCLPPPRSRSSPARPACVLPEQVRQLLWRHAPALVGHRDRDVNAVRRRDDADGVVSGACRAALEKRLLKTWTMRSRSASTRGRSGGFPPARQVPLNMEGDRRRSVAYPSI